MFQNRGIKEVYSFILVIFLINGCGSSSSNNNTGDSDLNPDSNNGTSETIELDDNQLSDGVVQEDINITLPVSTDDANSGSGVNDNSTTDSSTSSGSEEGSSEGEGSSSTGTDGDSDAQSGQDSTTEEGTGTEVNDNATDEGSSDTDASSEDSNASNSENNVSNEDNNVSDNNTSESNSTVVTIDENLSEELGVVVTIPSGTQFEDLNGSIVESGLSLDVTLSEESEVTWQNANETQTTRTITSYLGFTDADGNKVIPTEPIRFFVPAPEGLGECDNVVVCTCDKELEEAGLIEITMDADYNTQIVIYPEAFRLKDLVNIVMQIRTVENNTNSCSE